MNIATFLRSTKSVRAAEDEAWIAENKKKNDALTADFKKQNDALTAEIEKNFDALTADFKDRMSTTFKK